MNTSESTIPVIPNGSGAAAMLAAAIGSFVLAIIAFAGDKSVPIKNSLNFYKPTGRWIPIMNMSVYGVEAAGVLFALGSILLGPAQRPRPSGTI